MLTAVEREASAQDRADIDPSCDKPMWTAGRIDRSWRDLRVEMAPQAASTADDASS